MKTKAHPTRDRTLTLLSNPPPSSVNSAITLLAGLEEEKGRARGLRPHWLPSVADVKENPTVPSSNATSPGREKGAASEGMWTITRAPLNEGRGRDCSSGQESVLAQQSPQWLIYSSQQPYMREIGISPT